MHALYLAIPLLVCATTAQAQTFEIGGSIATSCRGSDGSFCSEGDNGLATFGPYASVWFGDRVEIGGRMVWLKRNDQHGEFGNPPTGTVAISDRGRLVAQGELIWHFRRSKRVRPMLGLGFGAYRDRDVVTCEPATCQVFVATSSPRAGPGEYSTSHSDTSIVTGVSIAATQRVRIRGGWRYHNPFKDELALSELFAAVGYRF